MEIVAVDRQRFRYRCAAVPDAGCISLVQISFDPGPQRADGKITRWFGTATDITDLVEARDTLRRSNDELEAVVADRTREREVVLKQLHESQKMESIGQLTGGVAHDFNNLLAVILGSLSLLKKGLSGRSANFAIAGRRDSGRRTRGDADQALAGFCAASGAQARSRRDSKAHSRSAGLSATIGRPDISIVVDIPPDIHPVKIDANQFELALMNLAVNARDAMPTGGTLTISGR